LQSLFETLKDFVYPDFFEKGPPYRVRGIIGGEKMMKSLQSNQAKKSILELITLGYRPATSLTILSILSESATTALHGMHIARELERRFEVDKGWFTKTRYYTDRVGRTLQLLEALGILLEMKKTGPKGKRVFSLYQIRPELFDKVRACLQSLSERQYVSLLSGHDASRGRVLTAIPKNLKECQACGLTFNSLAARYCERCGSKLLVKCPECKKKVEAFDFCILCGSKLLEQNL
jgi:hypothetical protein